MRFRHPDGSVVHLAYCTNVHPAEDLAGIVGQLDRFAVPVRERLGVGRLGVGLWLAAPVAELLASDAAALARFRAELDARDLEVVTFNGFPYGGFHRPVVKRAVYRPDWTEPARLRYTLDLARVLTGLLPDDAVRGSISSLPLAWREGWTADRRDAAARALDELAAGLRTLEAETGRTIRVGLEPEPGCIVETVDGAVAALAAVDRERIGVSLDACHLAVQFESPRASLAALAAAGLATVKIQAACALEVARPSEAGAAEALAPFAEPRFLHQVRELEWAVAGADDLADVLAGTSPLPGAGPWRVHVHLPLHAEPAAPIASTRPVLEELLLAGFGGPAALTDHVEVETYTWSVLPGGASTADDLVAGLAGELDWARRRFVELGLVEIAEVPA